MFHIIDIQQMFINSELQIKIQMQMHFCCSRGPKCLKWAVENMKNTLTISFEPYQNPVV